MNGGPGDKPDSDLNDAAVHGTHRDALRVVEMAFAFGAFLGVDHEDAAVLADRDVGTFRFAGRAARTSGRNHLEGHGSSPGVLSLRMWGGHAAEADEV